MRFDDSALTTAYTDGETSTPATVQLTDLMIGFGNLAGASSDAWLKVYTAATPSASDFVGDSTNQRNVAGAGSNHQETFTFDRLELDLSKTYYFYFAMTEGDGSVDAITFTTGRMSVSNSVNDRYTSGSLYHTTFEPKDTGYDAIFAATFVPEPSAALLGAFGALGLLRRRR